MTETEERLKRIEAMLLVLTDWNFGVLYGDSATVGEIRDAIINNPDEMIERFRTDTVENARWKKNEPTT